MGSWRKLACDCIGTVTQVEDENDVAIEDWTDEGEVGSEERMNVWLDTKMQKGNRRNQFRRREFCSLEEDCPRGIQNNIEV